MSLASTVNKVVGKAITKYATSITYTRTTAAGYNAATSSNTLTTASVTIHATVEDMNSGRPDGLVAMGDKKVCFAGDALANAPTTKDTLTIDGVGYSIVPDGIDRTYVNNVVVLYALHVRRG